MATSRNQRDVKLTLSVETLGEEGIKQLGTSLQQLAKDGSDAAPEFARLADEVQRIGQQSAALDTFRDLSNETDQLAQRQREATTTLEALNAELAQSRDVRREAAVEQRQANRAYDEAKAAITAYRAGLRTLKAQYDAGITSEANYRAEKARLTQEMGVQQKAISGLATSLKTANSDLKEAVTEEKKLENQYRRSSEAADAATEAFQQNAQAVQEAAAGAQALGVSVDDVAASQDRLLQSLNATGAAAQTLVANTRDLAEANERAAQAERERAAAGQQTLQIIQQEVTAQLDLERSFESMVASLREQVTAQQQAEQSARAKADADAEMAESNRLLRIQQEAMNALYREGADALQAETAAIREAAQASNVYVANKRQEAQATRQAAQEARAAADVIRNAFETIGIKSAQQLQNEIVQVRQAMATLGSTAGVTGPQLAGAFAAGEARINSLQREIREVTNTMTLGDKAAKLFANSLGQIAAGNLLADGIGFLIQKVKDLGVQFFTSNLELQRFNKALTQIYGDSKIAGEQLTYLRNTANNAGISVGTISDAFVRFSAATRSSGIELATTNALFTATARAAGVLGLTSEQLNGTLEALGQMASKGVVSMEELRQQLGDRLPGAISIAAKGLEVTEERLIKMVETGNLTTEIFFPAFTKGLEETFGKGTTRVDGFVQAWNRLLNAMREVAQRASDSSFFTNAGKAMDFLAENIDKVVIGLKTLGQAYLLIKAIDIVTSFTRAAQAMTVNTAAAVKDTAATIANTTAKTANAVATAAVATANTAAATAQSRASAVAAASAAGFLSVGRAVSGAATAAKGFLAVLGGLPGIAALVLLNARDIGTWLGESVGKWTSAGTAMKKYEEEMKRLEATERLAAETKRALQVEQDNLNLKNIQAAAAATKAAESAVAVAEKGVKAREAEIGVATEYAKILDNEEAALMASAGAAESRLTAQVRLSEASSEYVNAIELQIKAIEKGVDVSGNLTEKQTEQLTKLRALLDAKKEEDDANKSNVRSMELEQTQRRLAIELCRDNTDRVEELAEAYENARAKAQVLLESGVATASQLRKANADTAAATKLLATAYEQVAAKIKLKAEVEASSISITTSKLNVERDSYEQMAQAAALSGDLVKATYFEIEAKQRQIQVVEQSVKAKRIEAEATIQAAEQERRALQTSGQLTETKKLEIDLRINNAKAKRAEADAGSSAIKALEDEITALRRASEARAQNSASTDAQAEAMDRLMMKYTLSSDYSERQIALLERERVAQEKLKEAEDKRLNRDKEGFSLNTAGQRVNQQIETRASVFNQAKSSGLNDQQAQRIAEQFIGPTGTQTGYAGANVMKGENWGTELQKAINKVLTEQAQIAATGGADMRRNGAGSVVNRTAAEWQQLVDSQARKNMELTQAAAGGGNSKTITVNINGKSTSFQVAGDADASSVVAMLRQLESAANTTYTN